MTPASAEFRRLPWADTTTVLRYLLGISPKGSPRSANRFELIAGPTGLGENQETTAPPNNSMGKSHGHLLPKASCQQA
jgi:hypothetical protein